MDTIFLNSKNSKSDKIDLRKGKYTVYQVLAFTRHGKLK